MEYSTHHLIQHQGTLHFPQCINMFPVIFRVNSEDRLCGLVVRVPGHRSRGPEFESLRYQFFWEVVGLEWVPLYLVRITEELLDRKLAAPV
jgi:hypothetical protein